METIGELKVHYNWTEEDEENLRKVAWIGEKYKEEFVDEFYRYLKISQMRANIFPAKRLGVVFWLIYRVESKL